jgi:8-oxo-dGTP diphosphatase
MKKQDLKKLSNQLIKLHTQKPEKFTPKIEAVGCYVKAKEKLLMIQQNIGSKDENLWGIPGGKIDFNETPLQAIKRELNEEIGLPNQYEPKFLQTLFFKTTSFDYIFHIYQINFPSTWIVVLSNEHQSYTWCNKDRLLQLNLRPGTKLHLNLNWRFLFET